MKEKKHIRCKRCHRILKDQEAVERGYGYSCWKKHLMEKQHKHNLFTVNIKKGD